MGKHKFCIHPHGMRPVFPRDVEDQILYGHQLYCLGPNWPTLFLKCGCSNAPESLASYEPITPEQAHAWVGAEQE